MTSAGRTSMPTRRPVGASKGTASVIVRGFSLLMSETVNRPRSAACAVGVRARSPAARPIGHVTSGLPAASSTAARGSGSNDSNSRIAAARPRSGPAKVFLNCSGVELASAALVSRAAELARRPNSSSSSDRARAWLCTITYARPPISEAPISSAATSSHARDDDGVMRVISPSPGPWLSLPRGRARRAPRRGRPRRQPGRDRGRGRRSGRSTRGRRRTRSRR